MDKKTMGLWSCVALVVGNMIGSGIFMLPSVLAAYGPLTLWGWGASLIAALSLAIVFARLSAIIPSAGRAACLYPRSIRRLRRLSVRLVLLEVGLDRQRRHRGDGGGLFHRVLPAARQSGRRRVARGRPALAADLHQSRRHRDLQPGAECLHGPEAHPAAADRDLRLVLLQRRQFRGSGLHAEHSGIIVAGCGLDADRLDDVVVRRAGIRHRAGGRREGSAKDHPARHHHRHPDRRSVLRDHRDRGAGHAAGQGPDRVDRAVCRCGAADRGRLGLLPDLGRRHHRRDRRAERLGDDAGPDPDGGGARRAAAGIARQGEQAWRSGACVGDLQRIGLIAGDHELRSWPGRRVPDHHPDRHHDHAGALHAVRGRPDAADGRPPSRVPRQRADPGPDRERRFHFRDLGALRLRTRGRVLGLPGPGLRHPDLHLAQMAQQSRGRRRPIPSCPPRPP